MTPQAASSSPAQRRAGIRRTVWIAGALAFGFFVAFFIVQAMAHR